MKVFNEDELKKYDGSAKGGSIYIAFKGMVYDITESPLFIEGMHFEHYAGCDLTDYIADAPHGEEVMAELKVVGEYKK